MTRVLGPCHGPVWCFSDLRGPLALVCKEEAQLGHSHLSAETHHLPEHLLRIMSHQALLDVADVSEEITNSCDPRSAGGGDVIVAPLVTEFNAMSAESRHAA